MGLSEYVNITMGPKELAHRLSMVGLESVVEPRYSDKIEGVVTGRIVGLDKHPNADRLTVCQVETGSGVVEVVCGAPNVRIGLVSPLALPGARLKDGFKLKKSKIRGVESFGMLCAEDELGLSADHSGIMDLGDMEPEPGPLRVHRLRRLHPGGGRHPQPGRHRFGHRHRQGDGGLA